MSTQRKSPAPKSTPTTAAAPSIPMEALLVRDIQAEVQVGHAVALVCSTFHLQNTLSAPTEVAHDLPPSVLLCSLDLTIGEKTFKGQWLEKTSAEERFDDAVAEGKSAVLLTRQRVVLAALQPGEDLTVQCKFLVELTSLPSHAKAVALPLSLGWHCKGKGGPEEGGVEVTGKLQMASPFLSLTSPSHSKEFIVSKGSAQTATFAVKASLTQPELSLSIALEPSAALNSTLEPIPPTLAGLVPFPNSTITSPSTSPVLPEEQDSGKPERRAVAALLTFRPSERPSRPSPASASATEVVFVVDCSGSMSGQRIAQAKTALQLFLRGLPLGCFFNVVMFGSDFRCLFPSSALYTAETMAQATTCASHISASMGGTELLGPLLKILTDAPPSLPYSGLVQAASPQRCCLEVTRNVVVLTDGEVSNPSAIFDAVGASCSGKRTERPMSRVFALGIGEADRKLIQGLAKHGKGECDFSATSGEGQLEQKVMRLTQLALQDAPPVLSGARVDWGGLKVLQAPSCLPALYLTHEVVVCALIEDLQEESCVKLKGMVGSDPFEVTATLSPIPSCAGSVPASAGPILRLGIHQLMQELEKQPDSRARVVSLSLGFELVSSFTGLVVVGDTTRSVISDPLTKTTTDITTAEECLKAHRYRGSLSLESCSVTTQPLTFFSLDAVETKMKEIGAPQRMGYCGGRGGVAGKGGLAGVARCAPQGVMRCARKRAEMPRPRTAAYSPYCEGEADLDDDLDLLCASASRTVSACAPSYKSSERSTRVWGPSSSSSSSASSSCASSAPKNPSLHDRFLAVMMAQGFDGRWSFGELPTLAQPLGWDQKAQDSLKALIEARGSILVGSSTRDALFTLAVVWVVEQVFAGFTTEAALSIGKARQWVAGAASEWPGGLQASFLEDVRRLLQP